MFEKTVKVLGSSKTWHDKVSIFMDHVCARVCVLCTAHFDSMGSRSGKSNLEASQLIPSFVLSPTKERQEISSSFGLPVS